KHGRVTIPDSGSERFEPSFARDSSERSLLRFIGLVEVLQTLRRVGHENGVAQLFGQLALAFNALENRLPPFRKLPQMGDARLDLPDNVLIETARSLLAVTGDKGNGVALVQQPDHALDLDFADLKILGDP